MPKTAKHAVINSSMLVIPYNLSSKLYPTNVNVKFMLKVFGGITQIKDHLLQ